MKLLQFYIKQDNERTRHVGVLTEEGSIKALTDISSVRDVIRQLTVSGNRGAKLAAFAAGDGALYSQDEVQLLAPLTDPEKIICIGLNYHDHVIESNMQVPKVPVLFPKYNNCLIGHEQEVEIPSR